MKNNCNQFIFILGREQKIALLELASVLRRFCFGFYEDKNHPERSADLAESRMDLSTITTLSDNCVIINIPLLSSSGLTRGSTVLDSRFHGNDIDQEISKLINVLGGTTKIFKLLGEERRLSESLSSYFVSKPGKRLTFGISAYSKKIPTNTINMLGLSLKKLLKKKGSVRFVALRGENELSTAVSFGQRLDREGTELGIFFDEKARRYLIGKLIAVTNPNDWSHRDFDKPKSDKLSGMAPPKLARMMVNIALESNSKFKIQNLNSKLPGGSAVARKIENLNNCVVLDPFCGSGNILMEAAMLGCDVIGSDISEKAVNDTKENLAWLVNELNNKNRPAVIPTNVDLPVDAAHQALQAGGSLHIDSSAAPQNDSEDVLAESIENLSPKTYDLEPNIFLADATTPDFINQIGKRLTANGQPVIVVSEPYLGEPKKYKPTLNAARGEYSKVRTIYIQFLKNLQAKQLKSYKLDSVCLVFPAVETVEGKIFSLFDESVDEIRGLGYTLTCKPLLYGRDYQIVKREIVVLQKQ